MEALLYFLLWGVFIFLMMRLGHRVQVMGQEVREQAGGHGFTEPQAAPEPGLHWVPPVKDIDPVCNVSVSTSKAKPSVYAGQVYYFCSRECREVFEAAPNLYVHDANQPKLEHSHA